jgi:hypothetical protein
MLGCNSSRVDSGSYQTPRVIYAHASDSRVCGRRRQDWSTPSFGRRGVGWCTEMCKWVRFGSLNN